MDCPDISSHEDGNIAERIDGVEYYEDPGSLEVRFMKAEQKRISGYLKILLPLMKATNSNKRSKNAAKSHKLRNLANSIFSKKTHSAKEHLQIWNLYSESVALAPASSVELSSALYNRSVLSYHLKKYSECLQDLIHAEKCQCSHMLRMKIAFRRAECSIKLGSFPVENIVTEAIAEMKNLSIDSKIKLDAIAKLENMLANPTASEEHVHSENDILKSRSIDFQREIPCASTAVTLKYNRQYGRHIVSTRYIKPGEILAVEKVNLVLNLSNLYTHCSHCSRVSWASIPCESCAFAVYCSEKCKDEAWHRYHDIECNLIDIMYADGINTPEINPNYQVVLSTRLVIQALKEKDGSISDLEHEVMRVDTCKDHRRRGFSKNGILQSDSCVSFLSLLSNANKKRLCVIEASSRLAAMTVLGLAFRTEIFGEKFNFDCDSMIHQRDDMLFMGSLISRMHHAICTNQYELGEDRSILPKLSNTDMRNTGRPELERIGSFVAPFCSLINHACVQNAYRCITDDGYMVFYSVLPIEKDVQIFTSYRTEMEHPFSPKIQRQQVMRRLNIPLCECKACVEDWPLREQLPNLREMTADKELINLMLEITRQMVCITVGIEAYGKMVMDCLEKVVKKSLYPSKEFTLLLIHSTQCNTELYHKYFQIPPDCKK